MVSLPSPTSVIIYPNAIVYIFENILINTDDVITPDLGDRFLQGICIVAQLGAGSGLEITLSPQSGVVGTTIPITATEFITHEVLEGGKIVPSISDDLGINIVTGGATTVTVLKIVLHLRGEI